MPVLPSGMWRRGETPRFSHAHWSWSSRLIRVSGILSTTVDIVPLSKITDMTLRHSIPGRILGYGQLRVETAGQKQDLDRLDFLPSPGAVYRAML